MKSYGKWRRQNRAHVARGLKRSEMASARRNERVRRLGEIGRATY